MVGTLWALKLSTSVILDTGDLVPHRGIVKDQEIGLGILQNVIQVIHFKIIILLSSSTMIYFPLGKNQKKFNKLAKSGIDHSMYFCSVLFTLISRHMNNNSLPSYNLYWKYIILVEGYFNFPKWFHWIDRFHLQSLNCNLNKLLNLQPSLFANSSCSIHTSVICMISWIHGV